MPGNVNELADVIRSMGDLSLDSFEHRVLFAADDDRLVEVLRGERTE